jgi:hypothetical protein
LDDDPFYTGMNQSGGMRIAQLACLYRDFFALFENLGF